MGNSIKLAFAGDIISYECQNKAIKKKYGHHEYLTVFEAVAPLLEKVDYAVGSLETPIAGKLQGYTHDPIIFNTPDSILEALKQCGFDMLTTANNHCLDRGIEGLRSTIDSLDKYGFDHTGTQYLKREKKYIIKDFDGFRIAFVSYSYGTNYTVHGHYLDNSNRHMVNLFMPPPKKIKRPIQKQFLIDCFRRFTPLCIQMRIRPPFPTTKLNDCGSLSDLECDELHEMVQTIKQAHSDALMVIVLLHIGGQFNIFPGDYASAVVDSCVEAGASAVICNHSHTILPIEFRKECLIAHGLGNFSFTPGTGYYFDDVQADYSALLFLDIDKSSMRIEPHVKILKNVVGNDGISRIKDVSNLAKTTELSYELSKITHRLGLKTLNTTLP